MDPRAFYKMCDFLPPDPALISLLIPSYLPAVTINLSDVVYIIYKIAGIISGTLSEPLCGSYNNNNNNYNNILLATPVTS